MKKQAKSLTTAAAINLINHDNAQVFDIRDAEAFSAGHIINAISTPIDGFAQARMDKYKNKPLIIVCANSTKSQTLAATLRNQGFSQPYVLAGGMNAWLSANLPVVKGK